jgi:hypothetical protein
MDLEELGLTLLHVLLVVIAKFAMVAVVVAVYVALS